MNNLTLDQVLLPEAARRAVLSRALVIMMIHQREFACVCSHLTTEELEERNETYIGWDGENQRALTLISMYTTLTSMFGADGMHRYMQDIEMKMTQPLFEAGIIADRNRWDCTHR